ncbi:MAG: DNA ligase D [Pseudorhodoplanes sp.]
MSPQLATLVEAPPEGTNWLHEIKYDGYRAIAAVADGAVRIFTRNGLDWTARFRPLVAPLATLPCRSGLLDGEMAVADGKGRTDFGALQNALADGGEGIAYYVFDLLRLDGDDLRGEPLIARKAALRSLLRGARQGGALVFSDHIEGQGGTVFRRACGLGLEGIISKRADAPYRSGRGTDWLKSKCRHEQEFVIIGWRPSRKAGRPFSSLLLGLREGGTLRYAGRVGSGYSGARLEGLAGKFRALARKQPPVDDVPPAIARQARFLEPTLVAEIAFRGWTNDGVVRQGSFKGLRGDKPAQEIVKETPMPKTKRVLKAAAAKTGTKTRRAARSPAVRASDGAATIEGVRVTHPDRVLFAAQGVTKRTLIDYYLSVADAILPHVAERPLSLVRCPGGSGDACFFQKHASEGFPQEFAEIRIREKSGSDDYLYIRDRRGLVAAVQMGVLELHIWGCHVDAIERPDRMVFDFDPDQDLDFAAVRAGARAMRERLQALGLASFPLVTGGKGVHVVVPLKRGHGWEQHRDFAEALARTMAQEQPDRYVATMSKAKRKGKIFIDYLRNTRGATAIAPYSTRARAGAFVAVPVSWTQLSRLQDAHPVSVAKAGRSIGRGDPWPDYFKVKQALPLSKLSGPR